MVVIMVICVFVAAVVMVPVVPVVLVAVFVVVRGNPKDLPLVNHVGIFNSICLNNGLNSGIVFRCNCTQRVTGLDNITDHPFVTPYPPV